MSSFLGQNQWTRSSNGWIAGVCEGMGERFDLNPGMLRLFWLISILFFGVGLGLYLICAFVMPVEGNESSAYEKKILGVCLRLSERLEVDVVPLRLIAVVALLGSFGSIFLIYMILHFLLPESRTFSSK